MNFISCAKWIKKGVAKGKPERVELTQEELQKIIDTTRNEIKELGENGNKNQDESDEKMDEDEDNPNRMSDRYNFSNYDNEREAGETLFGVESLIVNPDDDTDDYKIKDEDHDSDEEDDKIKSTDNLIAVGHVEGDASVLEIFVYNDQDGDLYVHHDILLPSIPLCLEWLSYDATDSKPGNLLAVGSMSAVIAVWDLDLIDCLEPAYQLGKFSVKKKRNKSYGHKDAVLDVAWNKNYKHILASGSVDKTLLLWDLDTGQAATTFGSEFNDKVQSVKWNPNDFHSLLAGSGDKTAKLFDCRLNEIKCKWEFDGEIEKVAWSPWNNNIVYFGTNEGTILSYDLRKEEKYLWKINGHEKEITALELDFNCKDMLITCSMDESVKIWDIKDVNQPKLISCKSLGIGETQCLDLNPDCPYVACVGGTKRSRNFKVVNLKNEMLQSLNKNDPCTSSINTQMPVIFTESNQLLPSTSKNSDDFNVTENAFKSLTISKSNKPFKSKKMYGHKNRRTQYRV